MVPNSGPVRIKYQKFSITGYHVRRYAVYFLLEKYKYLTTTCLQKPLQCLVGFLGRLGYSVNTKYLRRPKKLNRKIRGQHRTITHVFQKNWYTTTTHMTRTGTDKNDLFDTIQATSYKFVAFSNEKRYYYDEYPFLTPCQRYGIQSWTRRRHRCPVHDWVSHRWQRCETASKLIIAVFDSINNQFWEQSIACCTINEDACYIVQDYIRFNLKCFSTITVFGLRTTWCCTKLLTFILENIYFQFSRGHVSLLRVYFF